MDTATHWRAWVRYVVAAGVGAAMSWFAFVADSPVPVFDWVDLGVHEVGHVITFAFPDLFTALAGSLLQVAVPGGLAVYFWLRQRDWAAAGFCMAWAGTSAWDVSVYVADAPYQALPLIGGGQHDWAYILGPQQFDAIDRAGAIAGFIETMGMVVAAGGIGLALWPAARFAFGGSSAISKEDRAEARPIRQLEEPSAPGTAFPAAPADGDPWATAARLPFFHHKDGRSEQ
jgi:hypothetical protein